jgi:hypothetical protein
MRRMLNKTEFFKWVIENGGADEAAILIKRELECSLSKAEKISRGNYNRELSASEQKALSNLTKISRDVLFKAGRPMKKAS